MPMIPKQALEAAVTAGLEAYGWADQYVPLEDYATKMLEVAAPLIQSGAWQEGWNAGWDDAREYWGKSANPYRAKIVSPSIDDGSADWTTPREGGMS